MYFPGLSVTVQVALVFAATPVFLFRPGPLRWKFCLFDASETVSLYLLAIRVLTFAPAPVFSEIVFAVTLPLSLPGAEAAAVAAARCRR